mgnify:CR=1 FL=1
MLNILDISTLSNETIEPNVKVEITDVESENNDIPINSSEISIKESSKVIENSTHGVQVEKVVADIRSILTEIPSVNKKVNNITKPIVTDNLCSLKTLVDVLGKWAGNEIRRRQVEDLIKQGSKVDDNLDDIEKVVEILKLWIKEGGSKFKQHNYFKNLDNYTLSTKSKNLSLEKKVEVLKILTELSINVSKRKVNGSKIDNIKNNLY